MNKNKENNKRVIPIILVIIGIITLLPVIISLFIAFLPVFILILFGLLIFTLIKLFRKSKKAEAVSGSHTG